MSEQWDWGGDYALPRSERLYILSPEEYEHLWGFPRFDPPVRSVYFTLNTREKALLGRLRTPQTKDHFTAAAGLFPIATTVFTLVLDDSAADLQCVFQQ